MNANLSTIQPFNEALVELSPAPRRLIKRFLFFMAIALPIPFGSVHEEFSLSYSIILAVIIGYGIVRSPDQFVGIFRGSLGRASQIVAWCLFITPLYVTFQYLSFSLSSLPHPLLGSANRQVDLQTFVTGWRETLNFLGVFLLARLYLGESSSAQRSMTRIIMLSGALVSFIALSHWFYDNGALFWTFEPETIRVDKRARWPFVNPNHLGDFLAPIFFLTLGSVVTLFNHLFEREIVRGRRRNRTLVALITSEDFHFRVIKPLILMLPLLSVTLALLGSQSRGAWFGTSVALIVFAYFSSSSRHLKEDTDGTIVQLSQRRTGRKRRRERSVGSLKMDGSWAILFMEQSRRFAKPLVVSLAICVVLFFLNSQGRDLVAGRIEYGLLYSMEDIRWTYYKDSWQMFLQHPIFGLGLGAWAREYSPFASPALAGLNPVYLHSDPYQLLIELGLVGFLPIATIVALTLRLGFSALSRKRVFASRLPLVSIFSGLIAFSLASLPEFPMRIPAISFLIATLLALYLAVVESAALNE